MLFAFILLSVSSIAQTFSTEYVDLGLPSGNLWAKCNLGATKPEEFGYYFAWGETQQKPKYDRSTYKWYNYSGSSRIQTKYCKDSSDGIVDNRTILELVDDAANFNLGGNWRMPTIEDMDELRAECTWTWSRIDGVNGYKVKGPNGNSIFLPASGGYDGNKFDDRNSIGGYYWSSSLCVDYNRASFVLGFYSSELGVVSIQREIGLSIRPIMSINSIYNISFDSNGGEGTMQTITTEYSKVVTLPKNIFTRYGYEFVCWNTKPDGSGISYEDSDRFSMSRNMTLYAQWYKSETNMPHKSVDLGLPSGIRWATCNVGASKPEEIGYFFAWGETKPKAKYNWDTYRFKNSSKYEIKDRIKSSCSYTSDDKSEIVLELIDDAANVNWGGDWRMPTKEEYDELLTMCTWEFTKKNGVNGYVVTGPNGKSIFMPSSIIRSFCRHDVDTYIYNKPDSVDYWSSCAYESIWAPATEASYLKTKSMRMVGTGLREKCACKLIRPVMSTYYVTFDGNGGEGYTSSLSTEYAREFRLPENNFTRYGYAFVGWNTKADGTGIKYLNRQDIFVSSFLTLYAQWIKYVDLGLSSGTLWATCNIGATKPEELGDEFRWGEVHSYCSLDAYKWHDASSSYKDGDGVWSTLDYYEMGKPEYNNMTKYNTLSSYGNVDNKTTLELTDDAANFNWGGSWRMPTKEELEELRTECTWIWCTENDVKGYKVTGPNGKSIFLPTELEGDKIHYSANYLSSSLNTTKPNRAYSLYVKDSSNYITNFSNRMYGLGNYVRPVMRKK